jgi:hypothetical protein
MHSLVNFGTLKCTIQITVIQIIRLLSHIVFCIRMRQWLKGSSSDFHHNKDSEDKAISASSCKIDDEQTLHRSMLLHEGILY